MIFPSHITSYKAPGSSSSGSESYSLDYSGLDEIRKRQNEASATNAGRYKALYDGNPGDAIAAGQRIRDLLGSLNSIEPVRMSSYSSNSSSNADGPVIGGEHADLKYLEAATKMQPAGGNAGGGGMPVARPIAGGAPQNPNAVKPDVQLPSAPAARKQSKDGKRPGAHVITGDPMRADYFA
jgi:hypothetical protein